jgi:GTP diphosphokinase / guanosine-3',5'-bis(diphosphate) 3'-diphosphatase
MIRLNEIHEKILSYNPDADLDLINKAYVFSAKVHNGQVRMSGEPYLIHPMEVAGILASLKMDVPTITAGLLHDTVEDTWTTVEEITELFGKEVADLVEGVTKISNITFNTEVAKQAENFRKMLVAMAKDIRVIIIKLADRLNNMRTLEYMPEDKRESIAKETLDIYAPIAHRLGIYWLKSELEDLSFRFTKPEFYYRLSKMVAKNRKEREKYVQEVEHILQDTLEKEGLKVEVTGRPKHLYGIYQKMEEQNLDFEQVYDITAFRILVDTIKDCYQALGIIHTTWRPVPDRFKDYIAMPKTNRYQSLHTTVIGPKGERVEIQIRTYDMHRIAEEGIAAHWKYKEGKLLETKEDSTYRWIRHLIEWQQELKDPESFMQFVKVDLFPDEVYVFTPKGDVIELPVGATPLDFAYAIHSDVGNHCASAKINGKIIPLKTSLKNGDTVEVITSPTAHPTRDWLRIVAVSKTKAKIRQWLSKEEREESKKIGKELLESEFSKFNLDFSKFINSSEIHKYLAEANLKNIDNLYSQIGYGKLSPLQTIKHLIPIDKLQEQKPKPDSAISKLFKLVARKSSTAVKIKGMDDILVRFAHCCNPIVGDPIVGFITRGRGITIHTADCSKTLELDPERKIEAEWHTASNILRPVKILVTGIDKPGLLASITNSISTLGVNIIRASVAPNKNQKSTLMFEIAVKDTHQLREIINSISKIKDVTNVERITAGETA